MAAQQSSADGAKRATQRTAERAASHPWVEKLGRFGYAAKGVVYAIIGVLAVQAAIGTGGQTTDTQGALQTIAQQPFGQILLGLVAVGLIGYVIWRFVQAGMDTENKGSDAKGVAARIGYAISGIIYGALAFTAVRLILNASSSGGSSQQSLAARVMEQPFGRWLVGIVGVIVAGFGLYQIYRGYSKKFREKLRLQEMSATEEKWAVRVGQFGLAARGVVLAIIGFFVVYAAIQYNPNQVQGTQGALQFISQGPFGWILLAIIAAGLIAYGIFMFFQARYRRMIFA